MDMSYVVEAREALGRKFEPGDVDETLQGIAESYASEYEGDFDFLLKMRGAYAKKGSLSPAQAKGVLNTIAAGARRAQIAEERAEAEANAHDAPEGDATVLGRVVATKWHETRFGEQLKMVVRLDGQYSGSKVWATVPKALHGIGVGDLIVFSAQFTRAEDTTKFAFGKRPRDAALLEKAAESA